VRAVRTDIYIQVGYGGSAEPWEKLFNPLGRTKQAILFTIPAGKDDGAHRLPTSSQCNAEAANELVESSRAAVRVSRSPSNPCIAVIAQHDNFVRDGAVDDPDDVPHGSGDILLFVDEVDGETVRRGPDVVLDAFVT
jgi:hypothetical protein